MNVSASIFHVSQCKGFMILRLLPPSFLTMSVRSACWCATMRLSFSSCSLLFDIICSKLVCNVYLKEHQGGVTGEEEGEEGEEDGGG